MHHAQHPIHRDPWLLATVLVACCTGIATGVYNALNSVPMLASSTIAWNIALPLTNLVTFLSTGINLITGIHTGATGELPFYISVFACYLVSAMCIFIAARCLTDDSRASFIGALLFLLNPTLLSFNTLALSDWLSIATLTLTCCCFLLWMHYGTLTFLIDAAMSSLLATLTCYDGWALFAALLLLLLITGVLRRQPWAQTESYLIAFGTLGILGVGVWMMLCGTVFGDPLAFLHSAATSTIQIGSTKMQLALFDLKAPIQTLGPLLAGIALLALAIFLMRRRPATLTLATLAFLVPFAFSLGLALAGGNLGSLVSSTVFTASTASTDILQAVQQHVGVATIAPAALFLSTLIGSDKRRV